MLRHTSSEVTVKRVPNRVFGIQDLAILEPGIQDRKEIWARDLELHLWTGSLISRYHKARSEKSSL